MNRRRSQNGLTLVEVVVALGLLLGVLLASIGLFVQAARVMRAGADATRALAIATTIVEEASGRGPRSLWLEFGRDGLASSYRFDSRVEPAAARWQQRLDAELYRARAELLVEALEDAAGSRPPLSGARGVRCTVTVYWSEGARRRSVSLQGVRI